MKIRLKIKILGSDFMNKKEIKKRLEYLRGEIKAEQISYGEMMELQSLSKHIEPGDIELLQWTGIDEN